MILCIISCACIFQKKKCSINTGIFFKPSLNPHYRFFFFVYPVIEKVVEKEIQNIIAIPGSSRNLCIDDR